MIAIEDVQLTPKRVQVGGNYLLRVRARDDAGGELTPVQVVHVDITLGFADQYTGQAYGSYAVMGTNWVSLPTIGDHTFWPAMQRSQIRPKQETDYITLTAGQYRATLSLRGLSALAGKTRDVTATLYAANGSVATTATVTDTQLGEDADYLLTIDGLTLADDGNYRLYFDAPEMSGAPTGFGQFLYGINLYRMGAST